MATMTDTYGADADIRDMLRESVGHPNQTVLLPDSTVSRVMLRALDKLNVDVAALNIGVFTTVADQQVYSPLGATGYTIRRVYWPSDEACASRLDSQGAPTGFEEFTLPIDDFGTRVLPDPASVIVVARRYAWLRSLSAKGAVVVEKSVYLDPIPSTSGKSVMFSYLGRRFATVGAVADNYREPYILLCESYLHERLASGAGAVSRVTDDDQGTSIETKQGAHALELSRRKLEAYRESLPPIPLIPDWP
jgi:hypothetical protein